MDVQDPSGSSGSSAVTARRPPARRWVSRLLIAMLVLLVVVGGTFTTLVYFRGYCAADFLPIDTEVTTSPYIQNVTSNAATVMWRTADEIEGSVTFGDSQQMDRTVRGETTDVHAIRLTELEPDTEYMYQAESSGTTFPAQAFRTPPGPQGDITVTVVGDTGTGDTPQEQLSGVMLEMDSDLVLHTGDVVYPRGGACDYEEKYYEPYQELIASVPVYPVLGNHDLLSDNGEPYLTAFELPAQGSGTERFYSFDYGPLHVTALNTELYYEDDSFSTEQQKAWLREDLRSTDQPWKIVVIHRPPYSSSPYHGGDRQILEDLVHIFEEEGVDVVFAGHEHVYERLEPINGVTYFVTGGGGADLRSAGTSELTAVSALRYHALKMEASPQRLDIEAIDVEGQVFDKVQLVQPSDDVRDV